MFNQMVAKLVPYFSYFFYAEVILLCLAILVGCFFILKKILTRPSFEGDPAYDYEKIAAEIEQEIYRLDNLKSRLLPGGVARKATAHDESAAPPAIDHEAPSSAQIDALVETRYKQQFDELRSELQKSAAEATQSSTPGDEATTQLAAQKDQEIERLRAELAAKESAAPATTDSSAAIPAEAQNRIVHLEKVLADYQVFEDDFAQVKKYKLENEQLRKQLESLGAKAATIEVPPVSAAVSEKDIANMFNELSTPTANAAPAPASEAPTKVPESTQTISPDALVAGFEQMNSQAAPSAAAALTSTTIKADAPPLTDADKIIAEPKKEAAPVNDPSFEVDKVSADPTVKMTRSDDTEALAESAATDDRLIAEFEKLLGGDNKT